LWIGVAVAPKEDMPVALKDVGENLDKRPPTIGKPRPDHQDATDGDDLQKYKMDSYPRGRAIIINNVEFEDKEDRDGAEHDQEILVNLFKYLGFEKPESHKNKKATEMYQLLTKVAKEDHGAYDCLLVAILTHGSKDEQVYGTDVALPLSQLVKLFGGNECHKTLIGKPKVFFVQACRGGVKDYGYSADQSDGGGLLHINTLQ